MDLFNDAPGQQVPLAERVRADSLATYVGQRHLLAPDQPLAQSIAQDRLHSMILWGPPGVGKTTLARLFAKASTASFVSLSAVLAGVKDIKQAVEQARVRMQQGKSTILFVDEVHRFNKAQQDALLPHIEAGTFVFVGATTENPSFEINSALISRARVYVLKRLSDTEVEQLLNHAMSQDAQLSSLKICADSQQLIAESAMGDGRRALNLLELAAQAAMEDQSATIENQHLISLLQNEPKRFDKKGDRFYEQISALHKSVRGSNPDAALYWCCRMLDAGCDPLYIARRVVRMASEEIGNADPRALQLACNAWDVLSRLGSPEGELALAQAVIYLASAPKSNAVYLAYNKVRAMIANQEDLDVPNHLCNAPTSLMQSMQIGQGYRYAHDEPNAFAAGEVYLPELLKEQRFYEPVDRGLEKKIAQKLQWQQQQDRASMLQRYKKKE